MKPARFILNSDFTTVRNTGKLDLKITIPNSFVVPADTTTYLIGRTTGQCGNASDSYYVVFESSLFQYVSVGNRGTTKPEGAGSSPAAYADPFLYVKANGNTFTFEITVNAYSSSATTFTGYGQTITAHIYTFKDPFSE